MRGVWLPLMLACALPGCAGAMPFLSEIFSRAISSPDGIQAKTGSGRNVHCQTGESGRTDCVEYRAGQGLRPGDPVPVGADPYAPHGANTNASAVPAATAFTVGSAPPGWQAPMPLPPAPVP
jgi:hypothetical protein